MRARALAIIGPGDGATADDLRRAQSLGALAAREGWVILNGGVASGVMEAASRGARSANGIVVGILPTADARDAAGDLTVAIVTGLGQARNSVLVLSSNAVAVCGMSPGTAVEAALALRAQRPLVFIAAEPVTRDFFQQLDSDHRAHFADSPEQAIAILRPLLSPLSSDL